MTYQADTDLRISTARGGEAYGPTPVRPDAEPIWSVPISGKEFDKYIVFHDDLAIIHRDYKEVIAVKVETGEIVWSAEDPMHAAGMKIEGFYWPSYMESAEGFVLISDRRFCVLDARDGSVYLKPTKRSAKNYPEAFAYEQYGDWLRKHTGDLWVHRASGETTESAPTELSFLDEKSPEGYAYQSLVQRENFVCGYDARWQGKADANGTRRLVCRDLPSWEQRWEVDLQFECEHEPPHPVRPIHILHLREAVVVFSDNRCAGYYLVLSPDTGRVRWRGDAARVFDGVSTGRLLHPPDEATHLLIESIRHKANAEIPGGEYGTAGEYEEEEVYSLTARNTRTGEAVWSTRDSLTSRYIRRAAKSSCPAAEITVLARTCNTLWLKQISYDKIGHRTAKPGQWHAGGEYQGGEKLPFAKQTAYLVAVDHNTGEVLHKQKLTASAQYAGQNRGRLYLREGRKMVCYA
jgi:hypothetical protein